jgi:hypothetical protein
LLFCKPDKSGLGSEFCLKLAGASAALVVEHVVLLAAIELNAGLLDSASA